MTVEVMVVVVVVVSTTQVVMLCYSALSIKDLDLGLITISVELISVRFVWNAVELGGLSTSAIVLGLIGISVLAVGLTGTSILGKRSGNQRYDSRFQFYERDDEVYIYHQWLPVVYQCEILSRHDTVVLHRPRGTSPLRYPCDPLEGMGCGTFPVLVRPLDVSRMDDAKDPLTRTVSPANRCNTLT